MNDISNCIDEVENLRLQVLSMKKNADKQKAENEIEIQKLNNIFLEYQELRKVYTALRKDFHTASQLKVSKFEYSALLNDNKRLKEEVMNCDDRLIKCRDASTNIMVDIDIIKEKLSSGDMKSVAQSLTDLSSGIDMDKILEKLSKPYTFNNQRDCETKIIELTSILKSIMHTHEQMQKSFVSKIENGESLIRQLVELKGEYEKLSSQRSSVFQGIDIGTLSLISENDKLREKRGECLIALKDCDANLSKLKSIYAEFKIKFSDLKRVQLSERLSKIKELNELSEDMHDVAIKTLAHRHVTFHSSSKVESTHKVLNKKR